MKRYILIIALVTVSLLLAIIFCQQLFSVSTFSRGDWPYMFPSAASEFSSPLPYYKGYNGLGQGSILFTGLETFFQWGARAVGATAGWRFFELFFWFIPLLAISSFSSYLLTKSWVGVLIYTTNTYILMIIGGGQFGVGLAYAFAPLVIYTWMRLFRDEEDSPVSKKHYLSIVASAVLTGVIGAIQVLFDPRIAIITLSSAVLYFVFALLFIKKSCVKRFLTSSIIRFVIGGVIIFLLNAFWILPFLLYGAGPLEHGRSADFSLGIVRFLSFSNFSHAFSLLHPNWPENIFGKTYFLQPEFLLIPILAFSLLLFPGSYGKSKQNFRKILFFSLLAIIGSFLAKGTSEPFGEVYAFLYKYVPGFILFRDATKFYLLIALSYSVVIPLVLSKIRREVITIFSKYKQSYTYYLAVLPIFLFVFFWLFLIRPVFEGKLSGTFRPIGVTAEYMQFAKKIEDEKSFSRILWVPKHQRFGYYSLTHPALSAELFFETSSPAAILDALRNPKTLTLLQEAAVSWVVVPTDTQSEIFLKERKPDNVLRQQFISGLEQTAYLSRVSGESTLAVFTLPSSKDHIWLAESSPSGGIEKWKSISPMQYDISLREVKKGQTLIFSEGYSRLWKLQVEGKHISPLRYNTFFMQFVLPRDGTYQARLVYTPSQIAVQSGLISAITLFVVTVFGAYVGFRYSRKRA